MAVFRVPIFAASSLPRLPGITLSKDLLFDRPDGIGAAYLNLARFFTPALNK